MLFILYKYNNYKKDLYIFLFSDILIITKINIKNNITEYQYLEKVDLAKISSLEDITRILL